MGGLYLATNGLRLQKRGRQLQVLDRRAVRMALPLDFIDRVVLVGPVGLTMPCLRTLERCSIPLLQVGRDGSFLGWSPGLGVSEPRGRVLQHLRGLSGETLLTAAGLSPGEIDRRAGRWRADTAGAVADFAFSVLRGIACLALERAGLLAEPASGILTQVVAPLVVPSLPQPDPSWLEDSGDRPRLTNLGCRAIAEHLEASLRQSTQLDGQRYPREQWFTYCSRRWRKHLLGREVPNE